jgi:hypothetical protein
VKIACRDIDDQPPLTEPKEPVGVPRQTETLRGITRLANLNGGYVLGPAGRRRRPAAPAFAEDRLPIVKRLVAVTDVSWSRCGGQDCVRFRGLASGTAVHVRPRTAMVVDELPPMAGRLVCEGDDMCFVPRFPFVDGTAYTVLVGGVATAVLVRPQPVGPATTEVLGIFPTAMEVPRNLLRLYVWFSAPMREGYAAQHVRLVDDAGDAMHGALLQTEQELWDAARRRLTVLLDPAPHQARLVSQRQIGYPLRCGEPFRLVVDDGFRDARGLPSEPESERRYDGR